MFLNECKGKSLGGKKTNKTKIVKCFLCGSEEAVTIQEHGPFYSTNATVRCL